MSFWANYATPKSNDHSKYGSLSHIDSHKATDSPVIPPPRRKKRGRSVSQPRTTQSMYDCPASKVLDFGYDRDAFTFNYINGLIKQPLKRHVSSDISLIKSIQLTSPAMQSTIFSLPNTPQPLAQYPISSTTDYCPFDYPQPSVNYPISPPPYDEETEVKHVFASADRLNLVPKKPFRKQQSLEQREMLEKIRSAHVYSIIKQKVDEKYFNKTRSMDSIFIPIRTSPSNEHLFHTIVNQQAQIQSLNEQQQFIQRVILTQQQQLKDSKDATGHKHHSHHHSHHRSRSSLPEAEAGGKRSSSRERIREQISKQQKQVADHIKQLHEQLNALMERRAMKEKERNNEITSMAAGNDASANDTNLRHSPSPSRMRHNASSDQLQQTSPKFKKRSTSSPGFDRKPMNERRHIGRRRSSSDESPQMSSSEYGEEEQWHSEDELDFSNQTVIPFHGRKGTFHGSNTIGQTNTKESTRFFTIDQQEEQLITKLRKEEQQEKERLRDLEFKSFEEEKRLRNIESERMRQEKELKDNEEEMLRQQNLFIEQQKRLLDQQRLLEQQNHDLKMQTEIIKIENEKLFNEQHSMQRSLSPSPLSDEFQSQQSDYKESQLLNVPYVRRNTSGAFMGLPIPRQPPPRPAPPVPTQSDTEQANQFLSVPHVRRNTNEAFANLPIVKPKIEKPKRKFQLPPTPPTPTTVPNIVTPNEEINQKFYAPHFQLNTPAAQTPQTPQTPQIYTSTIVSQLFPSPLGNKSVYSPSANLNRPPKPARRKSLSSNNELDLIRSRESTPIPQFMSRSAVATQLATREGSPFREYHHSVTTPEPIHTRKRSQSIFAPLINIFSKYEKPKIQIPRSRETSPFPQSPSLSPYGSDISSAMSSPQTPETNYNYNFNSQNVLVPPKPERSLNFNREPSPSPNLFATTTTTTETTFDAMITMNRSREPSPSPQLFPQQSAHQTLQIKRDLSSNLLSATPPVAFNQSREPPPSPQLYPIQNQQSHQLKPDATSNILYPNSNNVIRSREPSPARALPNPTPPVKPERSVNQTANQTTKQNHNLLSPVSAIQTEVPLKQNFLNVPGNRSREPSPNRSLLSPPNLGKGGNFLEVDNNESVLAPPPPQRRGASPMRTGSFRKRTDLFEDHFDQYVSPKAQAQLKQRKVNRINSKASSEDGGIQFTAHPISHSNSAEHIVTDVIEDVNLRSEFGMSMSALNESHFTNETVLRDRRQTLPDVSTLQNTVTEEQKPKTHLNTITEKKDKRKKSMFAESTTPPPQPEGWEREKVAAMAHEMRETRMREAMNTRLISFQKIKDWTLNHSLLIVVILINCYLAYYFYSLFKAVPNGAQTDDDVDE